MASYKSLLLSNGLPTLLMLLASKALRFSSFDLELPWYVAPLWFLPELLAWVGLCMLAWAALKATAHQRMLHTITFTLLSLAYIVLICMEGAALNFAHVTGSLLDAAMLHYAWTNAKESWDLINSSTPTSLKVVLATVSVCGVTLPHVLRRVVKPFAGGLPTVKTLAIIGAICTALPLLLVHVITPSTYSTDSALPGSYAIATSLFDTEQNRGLASTLEFTTRHAELKQDKRPLNVVLILLESTRASATTPYNSKLETTPFLDELSKQSIFAERAYAVMPHTSKAVVTTGCGVPPYLGVEILEGSKAGIPFRCMARLFDKKGYATAFFQSATKTFEQREVVVRNMGFKEFYPLETMDLKGFEKANYFGREDNVMLKPSIEWASAQKEPFFLTYLTVTPHHEYAKIKRYGHKKYSKKKNLNKYLNSVNYVDHFVKNVIDEFKAKGLYEHTIFAIVGDHGEGFGEHKLYQHDKNLYDEGLQVPLMIHHANQPPKRVKELVSQLDIAPTLIAMSGHTLENGALPGYNLAKDTIPKDRRLYSFCWGKAKCAAEIEGTRKYIHYYDKKPDELYFIDKDPEEKSPQREKARAHHKAHSQELFDWKASVNKTYRDHHKGFSQSFVRTTPHSPTHPLNVKFGDKMTVSGYDISHKVVDPAKGDMIVLSLYIDVHEDIGPGWKMFMHGFDKNKKMKNMDHVPVEGALPVSEFKKGMYIRDDYVFFISEKRPTHRFNIGFWHTDEGRLKATENGKRLKKDILKIKPYVIKKK